MKLRRSCSTAKPEPSPSAGSALAPSPPPTICRSGVVLADRRDGRGSEMALAERGSGLASSGLAHQHGRDELGHGTHGFGFYKAGVHGFRFYRTSDLTRCENWPPDRISRSWLPLTVARAVCVSFSLRKCVLEVQNRRFFLDFSLARAYRRSQDWDTRGEAREKRCRFGMPEEVMKKMLNWVMRVSARKMSLEWAMTRLQLLPPILNF